MTLPEGTRFYLLAPVVRGPQGRVSQGTGRPGRKRAFTRVQDRRRVLRIDDAPALDKKYKHDIEVVVDRLVVRADMETRLADSLRDRAPAGDGLAYVDMADWPGAGREREAGGGKLKALDCRTTHRVFREIRLPGVRLHHRGDRAAALFVQQRRKGPARPATVWGAAGVRYRAGRPQWRAAPEEGRGRALGQVQPAFALLPAGPGQASPIHFEFDARYAWQSWPSIISDADPLRHAGPADYTSHFKDGRKSYDVKTRSRA